MESLKKSTIVQYLNHKIRNDTYISKYILNQEKGINNFELKDCKNFANMTVENYKKDIKFLSETVKSDKI